MSTSKRFQRNKVVAAGLAAAATLAGGVGVGVAAASGPSGPQRGVASSDPEAALEGSLPANEVEGEDEQQEAERLAAAAKVSQSQAERAALAEVPGTVTESELGDEDGSVVWEVSVRQADASTVEVAVDAGNGEVLAQEAEEAEDGDAGGEEQDDDGEGSTG